jgi:hypothetical protein
MIRLVTMTEQPESSYQPPVSALLTIGDNDTAWLAPKDCPDYRTLFDLTEADIPELIRLATDMERWDLENLNKGEDAYFYPCIIACQILAQFQAVEAVQPLLECVNTMEANQDAQNYDWFTESFPRILGSMTPAAIPLLNAFLNDSARELYVSSAAASGMVYIAEAYPEARAEVIAGFIPLLSLPTGFNATLNGLALAHLLDLKPIEALDTIRAAFINSRVDLSILDYNWVQEQLGMKPAKRYDTPEFDRRFEAMRRLLEGNLPADDEDTDADGDESDYVEEEVAATPRVSHTSKASAQKQRKQQKARRKQGSQQRKKGKKR